jgi:multicomponent Na+:H+ antiporter subunit D
MKNIVALPVLLPLATGILLLFLHGRVRLQRVLSLLSAAGGLVVALAMVNQVWHQGVLVAQASGWKAPFGITLAVDLFAALMLILSGLSGLLSIWFGMQTLDAGRERYFYYPLTQFLLVGINLSFVTGDLFNLYVAFEVMLISSYFLLTLGGSPGQLREGFKYLVLNVVASTLFLLAITLLYGVTASLNMADVAVKVSQVGSQPIVTLIAVLFMLTFGMKGALFPLYFWLPRAYVQAPPAIASLFAGMLTKVGVYALIRVMTLIFTHDPGFTQPILLFVAGGTMLLGVFGAIAQTDAKAILSYHIISQIGYMVMGLGLGTELALAGAVFYIAHHILVKSALFLLAGVIEQVTGTTNLNRFHGLLRSHAGLGFTFLATGLSLAGIPPFSGFFAKFALMQAAFAQGAHLIAAVSMLTGLFTLYSMVKIFRKGFWGEEAGERRSMPVVRYAGLLAPGLILLGLSTAIGLAAGPMMALALKISHQLASPSIYIEAVLGR